MRTSFFFSIVAFVYAAAIAQACAPAVELGRRCTYNSDCPEELACVVGRCGSECRAHRDCALGAECLIGSGLGRCALEDDRCPCADGLVCGSDERCHSPCGEQCPDGTCATDGTCRRPEVVDGSRTMDAAPPSDAAVGSDAGVGIVPHVPCDLVASTCPEGQRCIRDVTATPVCRIPCAVSTDCPTGERCALLDEANDSSYCSIACDPVGAAGCPAGDACDLVERLSLEALSAGASNPYLRYWDCRGATPTGTAGAPCEPSSPEDCAIDHTCIALTTSACARLCPATSGGAASASCDGVRCVPLETAPPVSGIPFGHCDDAP